MKSRPIHRSETQKEAEDRHYLARLIRTQSRMVRLKQRAPTPLYIPRAHPATATPAPSFYHGALPSLNPRFTSSASTIAYTSTTSLDALPQTHYAPLEPQQQQQQPSQFIHPHILLVPSRGSTPTPPIPKRPTTVTISSPSAPANDFAAWRASSATLLEISVLDDTLDYDFNKYHKSRTRSSDHEKHLYPEKVQSVQGHHRHHSSYDYGALINYRTGADQSMEALSAFEQRENEIAGHDGSAGRRAKGTDSSHSQENIPRARSPQLLEDPDQVYQQQLARRSRQEQMLKRSSQLLPLHHRHKNYPHQEQPSGQGAGWGQQWRKLSKKMQGGRDPVMVMAEPERRLRVHHEMSEEEKKKLEELFEKKRILHDRLNDVGMRPTTDDPLDLSEVHLQDDESATRGDDGGSNANGSWLHRPSGVFPLGLVVGLICTFMLAYNGVLSAFVFQASQFPDNTNVPVFILSILFIFAAVLSIFGFVISWLLSRSVSRSRRDIDVPFRAPHILFKTFHFLYFLTSFLTCGGMLGWLGLNKVQTGDWGRMYIKDSPPAYYSMPSVLTFESLLQQDPLNPNAWILDPKIWIVTFVGVWAVQVYFWICLVAFARQALVKRRTLDERERARQYGAMQLY